MKYILIIGDGMADNPVDDLDGMTPLQYAAIPTIDMLAEKGELGSVLTVPKHLPPGSDTAILSIFGCDPNFCYTGRAPLEAAASNIKLNPGDAAFRCNMVTFEDADCSINEKKILSHSAGSIEGEQSYEIIKALFADPEFSAAANAAGVMVHPSYSFRHIAEQKQADLEGIVLTPPHDRLGEAAGDLLPRGNENAGVLKELMILAHEKLNNHPINEERRKNGKLPANGIWFWAEGTAVSLPNFYDNYKKTGGVISAVPLCHGIAALTGLDMISVEGATGELETNYQGKVDAAIEVLKDHDFAAIHLEAPDECTHNGDLKGKLMAIEWLDSRIVAPLVNKLFVEGIDYRILILSDHKTLTSTRGHDGDPVPYIIFDSTAPTDSGLTYCEKDAEKGPYIDPGVKLMSMLFSK